MADYQSQYTGAAVDAAAFISQFFNISGAPSQGQILIANGQGKFMPDNMPIPTNIPTANITLSTPQNNNTSLNPGDPLNNMINAVNGKVNSNGGNGSQVNVTANALYSNDLQLNQPYTLAQLVGYLCNKQNSPTSTNFSALNTAKNINYLSNKTIKNIQILFDNVEPQSGTSYLSLTINNKQYNSIATTVYESPIKGYIKAEYNGYNWVVMVCYSTNNSENIGSPNIYIKTDSSANTLTMLTLSASRAVSGTFKATVFYD